MRVLLVLLLVLLSGVSGARAQVTAKTPETNVPQGKAAYTLPPEKLARAIAYSRARTVLGFAETGCGIAVLGLLLVTGAAAGMRRVALRAGKSKWAQGAVFLALFLGVTTLLALPLTMYGHHLAVQYGQSVQHWASWFGDQAKGLGLAYAFGLPAMMLLLLMMRISPKRWWFWFWIPAVTFVVIATFVYPIFIDPLFNKFEPLAQSNPALVQQLETVVARGGIVIPPERMFLMKASEKVTGLNAYVTGIGASKRVVVWDTSIAKATPEEIQFIFGHEMGHYVLNHIYKGMAFAFLLILVLFWLGFHGMHWLIARYGAAWGVSQERNWAWFVVLMLVISMLSFVSDPLSNGFSRWEEHQADVYGQEAIHGIVRDPQAVAQQSFQVLGEQSLVDPNPNAFVEFWTFSHPSIGSRAAFAASYDPWVAGREPQYFPKP